MKRIIHWIALKCSRVSTIRSISIYFDTQNSGLKSGMIRLFLEGYFDMMMTLAMMLFIPYRDGINEGTLIYFWDNDGDKLNGIFGGLLTLPLLIFPVFVYRTLTWLAKSKSFEKDAYSRDYESLYEGLKLK